MFLSEKDNNSSKSLTVDMDKLLKHSTVTIKKLVYKMLFVDSYEDSVPGNCNVKLLIIFCGCSSVNTHNFIYTHLFLPAKTSNAWISLSVSLRASFIPFTLKWFIIIPLCSLIHHLISLFNWNRTFKELCEHTWKDPSPSSKTSLSLLLTSSGEKANTV